MRKTAAALLTALLAATGCAAPLHRYPHTKSILDASYVLGGVAAVPATIVALPATLPIGLLVGLGVGRCDIRAGWGFVLAPSLIAGAFVQGAVGYPAALAAAAFTDPEPPAAPRPPPPPRPPAEEPWPDRFSSPPGGTGVARAVR